MSKTFTTSAIIALFALLTHSSVVLAQKARNGMNVTPRNYKTFTPIYKDKDAETIDANKAYQSHPEVGMLFAETPCDNCYELIGERTEISKTFLKKGEIDKEGKKKIYRQTSTLPMHYHDAVGNWKTINTHLTPVGNTGVYSATEQPVPVVINTTNKSTSIGKAGESFTFNNDLELVYMQPDGIQVQLGKANWAGYTAGDDGVYVTNAWPGIDIEIYADRGMTKTNFFINHSMPQYAAGKLLVRDHFRLDNGLSLSTEGRSVFADVMAVRNSSGDNVYVISPATAGERNNIKATIKELDYYVSGNTVDIALPGEFLNRAASAYPVVIDPLVSSATSSTVTGSTYSAGWTVGCPYTNLATTPANCTITDVQFTFGYITSGGAVMYDGAMDFSLGACRNPSSSFLWWSCGGFTGLFPGTCSATNQTLFPDLAGCVPPPQCTPYNLNIGMNLYQSYATTAPCAITYISGASPLVITVIGNTVGINTVNSSAGGASVCAGQSVTLSTSAGFGVPPYTYSWLPGSLTGSPITVSPTATTTYTATVTDACGITSSASATVTVSAVPPITGTMAVCVGGTTALGNASGGGTWSSSNTSVANVGTSSGIVSGVSVGTTTITYTTSAGCVTTATVTVNLLSGITGTTTVCVNGTSTLGNTLTGGTWSSSNTGIVNINASTGVATGVSAGTAVITYVAGSGCSTTINFTVNPLPAAIGGPSAVCSGSTVSLTDATVSGVWSSSATTIATISTNGVAGGVAPGLATISYTLPITGCYITAPLLVNPIYSTSFNITICPGSSYVFAGFSYSATGIYPRVFTSIAGCDSIVALHLTVDPVTHTTVNDSVCIGISYFFGGTSYTTSGAYTHNFTNINGCDSIVTLNLFIKPLPPIPGTTNIDLCQNATPVSPLTATGASLLWYNTLTGGIGSVVAPVPSVTTPGVTAFFVSQTVNGCESPHATLNVTVHNKPNYTIVPGKPYECQYDTISLNYNGPLFTGITFAWTVPAYAAITAGTAADPSIVTRFDTSVGSDLVYLTVGDGYVPCNTSKSYSVPVFLTAPPAFFNSNPNVCAGDSILIALTYTSPGINDYIWNFDGGRIVAASSNHGGPYRVVWNTPGAHVISLNAVTNPNCPATLVTDTINVQTRPDARIAPFSIVSGKDVPCMGDSILFSPLNFSDRYSYFWSPEHYFNQDNSSRQFGVVDNPGYIKLTVSTPFGCKSQDSILVDAQPCCTISFPTAFTPNGDQKNDVFRPLTVGTHRVHFFRVVNRWGENVFESLEEGAGAWDGTYNGVKQDMGVYYYFISYDCNNTKMIEKGEVTLIR